MSNNLRSVIVLWSSTLIWGILNYLYHPLMIRWLDIDTFATFEWMVSIFNILAVLTAWFILFLTKEVATHKDDQWYIHALGRHTNRLLLIIAIIAYVLFIIFSPLLAQYLHLTNVLPLVLTWTVILFSFLSTFPTAALQWQGRFGFLSVVNISSWLFKLAAWVAWVALWRGLYGAIGWFVASSVVIYLLSYRKTFQWHKNHTSSLTAEEVKTHFLNDKISIGRFFLLVVFLAARTNIDILLVNNLFHGSEITWVYAWLSVIAKCIIFLWAAIETVYYPQIMQYVGEKKPVHFLLNAWWMITILGIVSLIGWYFLWPIVLDTFHAGFGAYNNYFMWLIVFCWIYTYISMYGKVLIGRKDKRTNRIIRIWLLVMVILTSRIGNTNITDFIRILCITGAVTMFTLLWRVRYRVRN